MRSQVSPRRAEDAEPVDDLVGHEVRRGVPGFAVMAVVVPLSAGDVSGQRLGHPARLGTVALDDVSHVVAHHPPNQRNCSRWLARSSPT